MFSNKITPFIATSRDEGGNRKVKKCCNNRGVAIIEVAFTGFYAGGRKPSLQGRIHGHRPSRRLGPKTRQEETLTSNAVAITEVLQ